jgi:hypothetical protein
MGRERGREIRVMCVCVCVCVCVYMYTYVHLRECVTHAPQHDTIQHNITLTRRRGSRSPADWACRDHPCCYRALYSRSPCLPQGPVVVVGVGDSGESED